MLGRCYASHPTDPNNECMPSQVYLTSLDLSSVVRGKKLRQEILTSPFNSLNVKKFGLQSGIEQLEQMFDLNFSKALSINSFNCWFAKR